MSYTETNSGKVKFIGDFTKEQAEEYCKEATIKTFGKDTLPPHCESWIDAYNELSWDKFYHTKQDNKYVKEHGPRYLYVKGKLWFAFDIQEHEAEGFFVKTTKIDENTFTFCTQFYNGGTCLEEILEEECEKIEF